MHTALMMKLASKMSMSELFSVLGINENSSPAEVKAAKRKYVAKNHPDRNPGNDETFGRVMGAFDTFFDKDHNRRSSGAPRGSAQNGPGPDAQRRAREEANRRAREEAQRRSEEASRRREEEFDRKREEARRAREESARQRQEEIRRHEEEMRRKHEEAKKVYEEEMRRRGDNGSSGRATDGGGQKQPNQHSDKKTDKERGDFGSKDQNRPKHNTREEFGNDAAVSSRGSQNKGKNSRSPALGNIALALGAAGSAAHAGAHHLKYRDMKNSGREEEADTHRKLRNRSLIGSAAGAIAGRIASQAIGGKDSSERHKIMTSIGSGLGLAASSAYSNKDREKLRALNIAHEKSMRNKRLGISED